MTRLLLLACAVAALGACTRWSVRPVPVERAFANDSAHDVAVRLADDSTHWRLVRQARLAGDSIVGESKATGRLLRVAMPRDQVLELVVRERDQVAGDALTQIAEFACFIGLLAFAGLAFPIFTPKGWSM